MKKYGLYLILALSLLVKTGENRLIIQGKKNEQRMEREEKEKFRMMKVGDKKWEREIKRTDYWEMYMLLLEETKKFPVAKEDLSKISYENGWQEERNFGGKRNHEGCDLMDNSNQRGAIPIFSVSEGIVEEMGWLKLGGYRVGIRSPKGVYYYYAHLDSYSPLIKKGKKVGPGQLLGYMGDSGYGKEGTKGKFPVHLHFGIYLPGKNGVSINSYYLLKKLEESG